MSVTFELAPEIEQLTMAQAEARGVSLEEHLQYLITKTLQQEEWDSDEGLSETASAGGISL